MVFLPSTEITGAIADALGAYPPWETALLGDLHITPNITNLKALNLWAASEGVRATANNPLAITDPGNHWPHAGIVAENGGDPVYAFPSLAVGAQATAAFLQGSGYGGIRSALANGDLTAIYVAINSSGWCRGCQGGHYPVQLYQAIHGNNPTAVFHGGPSSGAVTVGTAFPPSVPSTPSPTQGFGNLSIGDITINAGPVNANYASAVTDVIVERNIASASTVTIQLADPLRTILRSQIYKYTDMLELDGLNFALVEIVKTGDQLQNVFEAEGVFLLRQQRGATASANTVDITGFAEQLVRQIPGLGFVGESTPLSTPIAVGRGTTSNPDEDSWTCLVRIAATAGWRLFESNNVIHFGSDPFWISFPSVATLQEWTANIYNMDFDFDIGQPFGNITVTGVSALWAYPPGSVVTLVGMGPANGNWLVNDMQRDFYSPEMTVTLQQALTPDQFLNPSEADLGITGVSSSSVA